MPITSAVTQGLIYAGDTPLACSIRVEQTGPMELTLHAGTFTTTGQARIRDLTGQDAASISQRIADGLAGRLADGKRWREWLTARDGTVLRSETFTIGTQRLTLTSDPARPVRYAIDLVSVNGAAEIRVSRIVDGRETAGAPPPGARPVQHPLVFAFMLPAGAADLAPLTIYTLTVLPGFPPGTGPEDWRSQGGVQR